MQQEAATQLLEKMHKDEWYSDICQYSRYYINLIKKVINKESLTEEQYMLLVKELKVDINDKRKTYRDEAAKLLGYLLA